MVGICGYHRTASANDQGNYVRELMVKVFDLMVTEGYPESTHVKRTPAFANNKTLGILISALDMFWCKYKGSPYGSAQM